MSNEFIKNLLAKKDGEMNRAERRKKQRKTGIKIAGTNRPLINQEKLVRREREKRIEALTKKK